MTMTGHILREDSFRTDGQSDYLEVGAPFFRGMPLSGVSAISVNIGEVEDSDPLIKVQGEWHQASSLSDKNLGEWFLQDRFLLKLNSRSQEGQSYPVSIQMKISPPQFRSPAGDPVVLPVMRRAELTLIREP